jgi:beta-glucuronidase
LLFSFVLFSLGFGSLLLTLWLWLGDWPAGAKAVVDHHRSLAENAERAPDPTLANIPARSRLSLAGTWQAVIDPYGRGELGGMAPLDAGPGAPSDHAEFSFANGLTLEVPGDWNTQDPRLVFYRGVVWYKRSFDLEPQPGRRSFLYFGAVNYRASVYLNGLLLGEHVGGFTPFNFEVTDGLKKGENLLVVRVDNDHGPEDVPTPLTDWLNYGGMTREVALVDLPEVFVRDYAVQLAEGARDRIAGWVELGGGGAGLPVELSIPELHVSLKLRADAEGRADFDAAARPELWSPGSPRLYRLEIRSGKDTLIDEIGFRTVEVRGDEILLNDEPVFLRGISIHEEAAGGGRIHSEAQARRLLDWAQELGANFVRLAHYPHNEAMVRLADRMGLLVWEEIPVYWNVDFASPYTLELAKRQLSELIERDRNRASVILWSIGNETPATAERNAFLASLAEHVRSLDATRLVTAALLTSAEELGGFFAKSYIPALFGLRRDEWVMEVNDPLAEIVDVPALNEYFGWYYSGALGMLTPFSSHYVRSVMLDNLDRIRIEIPVRKPLVLSEFGAGALKGWRAPESELVVFSEDYQALVYRRQIAFARRQSQLRGMSPWILKDFRSPLRLYQGVQDYWNRKGLVSDQGRRKLAFGVLRSFYGELGLADRAP